MGSNLDRAEAMAKFKPPIDEEDLSKLVRELADYAMENEDIGARTASEDKTLFLLAFTIIVLVEHTMGHKGESDKETYKKTKALIEQTFGKEAANEVASDLVKHIEGVKTLSGVVALIKAYKEGKFNIK